MGGEGGGGEGGGGVNYSILEQSSNIWHSTLSIENSENLERVQKNAVRNILQEKYETYDSALKLLKLETLYERREKLILKFGLKCTQLDQTKHLFPQNRTECEMETRNKEKYKVNHARTNRYKNSTVPYIQRKLNSV